MIDVRSNEACQAAFAVGVALHLFLFRIGEWDLYTARLLGTFAASYAAGVAALLHVFPDLYPRAAPLAAAQAVGGVALALVLGIASSMLVYRGFFHRLCRFPGPFLARFSNLYVTRLSAKKLHLYEEVQALHRRYGDYVRLGPSELSINDRDAVAAIHSAQSTCVKGPWYNVQHPLVSLHMIRDKAEHIRRRKVWDRGFSAKALRDYEPRVVAHARALMEQLARRAGTPVNVTDWFNFYSFDVMGDLAWATSFGMVRGGTKHYFMTSLHADMQNVGLFGHMLWLFPLFKATPILNAQHKRFWRWVHDQVEQRKAMTPERPDVFSWLLQSYGALAAPTRQDDLNLLGDTSLIAVAGSDTTAATLTCLFFELTRHPACLAALQAEVDALFRSSSGGEGEDSIAAQGQLKYLDAVINETLRLHPAVPSGVQRMTPPEGLRIGDHMVPGNTIVQIPSYTMFRDERFFERPDEFIPERWTSRKALTKDASVFVPFSTGRYSCIGKQLGLMEVRYVATQIVRRYSLALAPDQDPQAFLDGKRDTFTLALAPLHLVFAPRDAGDGRA